MEKFAELKVVNFVVKVRPDGSFDCDFGVAGWLNEALAGGERKEFFKVLETLAAVVVRVSLRESLKWEKQQSD